MLYQRECYQQFKNTIKQDGYIFLTGIHGCGKKTLAQTIGKDIYQNNFVLVNSKKNLKLISYIKNNDIEGVIKHFAILNNGITPELVILYNAEVINKLRSFLSKAYHLFPFKFILITEFTTDITSYNGEHHFTLYPLTFKEFFLAMIDDDDELGEMKTSLVKQKPLPAPLLRKYENLVADYCKIGGTINVVKKYEKNKDFKTVKTLITNNFHIYMTTIKMYSKKAYTFYRTMSKSLTMERNRIHFNIYGQRHNGFKEIAEVLNYNGYILLIKDVNNLSASEAITAYFPDLGITTLVTDFSSQNHVLAHERKIWDLLHKNLLVTYLEYRSSQLKTCCYHNHHSIDFILNNIGYLALDDKEIRPLVVFDKKDCQKYIVFYNGNADNLDKQTIFYPYYAIPFLDEFNNIKQ